MSGLVRLEHGLITVAFAAYLVGAVLYIVYISFRKDSAARFGRSILYIGITLHAVSIILRGVNSGHAPFSNMYESLSFFAWGTTAIFLYVERRYRLIALGAFSTPITVLIMGYASVMSREAAPLVPALQSYWLWIHVMTCFAAYAAFAISLSASLMYFGKKDKDFRVTAVVIFVLALFVGFAILYSHKFNLSDLTHTIRHYMTFVISIVALVVSGLYLIIPASRRRFGKSLLEQIPSEDDLDKISYQLIKFAFPFLSLGIITGAVWANYAWGRPWSWDPKETWSLITWFIYAIYLHARITAGWKGRRAALVNILGFVSVIFTYIGVNFMLSGLHSYAQALFRIFA